MKFDFAHIIDHFASRKSVDDDGRDVKLKCRECRERRVF